MIRLGAFAALLAALLAALPLAAQDLPPREVPFQGVLEDGGAPVTATTDVTFRLFDVASGGTAVWTETQTVTPGADGAFAARLGAVTALPDDLGRPLWLAVEVADQALGPRTAFGAVPYALGLYGLTVTPNADPFSSAPGPNLAGGYAGNVIGPDIGGATISGGGRDGAPNTVTARFSTVGGGSGNTASGTAWSTVGGGERNTASGSYATVGGGFDNTASGYIATVGGGVLNTASTDRATVGGGEDNTASGTWSTVGGGNGNTAYGAFSTVAGGLRSHARGSFSFAAGYYARSAHDGTFVWSDDSRSFADSLVSTGPGQFLIRAAGGVGIGTDAPLADLHVEGARGLRVETQNIFLQDAATHSGDLVVESTDAVLGLYSTSGGGGGSAVSLGEVNASGALTNKWAMMRGTGATGALHFTFGTSFDYGLNDTQMRIDPDGSVHADGSFTGGGADFAEWLPLASSTAAPRAGDVVGVTAGRVGLATEGAEQVMVVSSDPAFVGNPDAEDGGALVALVGQVEVRLASSNGAPPPQVGDLLVASGRSDGRARAVSPARYDPAADGAVIGRVLGLADDGTAVALVGVDEAAALRGVVAALQADRDRQAADLEALRADRDAQQAQIDALARRLDALTGPEPTATAHGPRPRGSGRDGAPRPLFSIPDTLRQQ